MYSTVCTGVQNDCFDPSRVIEGRAPLESGELRPPAGRDRWTDDGYRVGQKCAKGGAAVTTKKSP